VVYSKEAKKGAKGGGNSQIRGLKAREGEEKTSKKKHTCDAHLGGDLVKTKGIKTEEASMINQIRTLVSLKSI